MKKTIIVAALLVLLASAVFAASTTVRCELPVLITSAGQSVDGSTVASLLKRVKITQYTYDPTIDPSKVNWGDFKTVIVVIGGSGKGLGSAGVSVADEEVRVKNLLDAAKQNGKKIIAMHIGGQDRRGANSVPFLPYASYGDLIIVNANGNADGYFTKLASDNGIPFVELTQNTEIGALLQEVFGK